MKNYIMKPFSFIISIFLVCKVYVACINKRGNSYSQATANVIYNNKDTIIIVKKVPEEISGNNVHEVEYFVSINSTNYSPVILISKIQNRLIIKLKSNIGDYSVDNMNDTNAVEKRIDNNSVKLFISSEEKYNLIRRILERVSKDFELSKTQTIFLDISTFEEEVIQITEKYKILYGLECNNLSNERMADIIKESSLYKNLCVLFNQYSIKMGQVYVEDIMCVSPDRQESKMSKNKLPYVLDASVIISTIN